MAFWKDGGFTEDPWTHLAPGEAPDMGRQQILPLTTFLELDASQRSGFGVSLAPLEDLETLRGARPAAIEVAGGVQRP